MTTDRHSRGRAVGASASDFRSPPAIQESHQHAPLAAMHQKGLGPYAPFSLVGDRRIHRFAIGSDCPGVKAGFYDQCELARSLGNAQARHFRQRLIRMQVARAEQNGLAPHIRRVGRRCADE